MSITELVASLDDAPDADTPDGTDRDRYRITDDGGAAWAMRRLAAVQRRRADIAAVADQEIARVEAWAAAQTAPLDRDVAYFEGILGEYAKAVRGTPGDGRKSVSTPYGVVSTRAGRLRWTVTDPAALLGWAQSHRRELVTVTETVKVSDASKALAAYGDPAGSVFDQQTGDEVPGITAVQSGLSVAFTLGPCPVAGGVS